MKKQNGYTALLSAIIISLILLGMASTLSFRGFFGRLNILESEFKQRSLGIAEACADRAILKLINDPTYSGNQIAVIDGQECQIYPIKKDIPAARQYTIETKTTIGDAVSNIRAVVTDNTYSIISWEEIPSL